MADPLILLSNDDGFDSRGLAALRTALESLGQVIVCAPAQNQSASSHALTLNSVLRLKKVDKSTYIVNGTPADCIYVALHSGDRIVPRRPDLVVSGMNHGPNLGIDIVYSGTVGAAREAAHRGIPALAVSADTRADFTAAATLASGAASRLLTTIGDRTDRPAPLLNVNIPRGHHGRIRATVLGRRLYDDGVLFRRDPRGREYLWIGGSNVRHDETDGTDTGAWEAGIASLTPLTLDLTAHTHDELAATVCGNPDP